MCALLVGGFAIPGTALPILGIGGGSLVHAFPPHGVVVLVEHHIGEQRILRSGCQRIGVGLGRGAGGYAKEAVLGVHSPKSAVGADPQPGDIVAHRPDLVALLPVLLRGHQHGQIGLAAGRGERGGDIADLALGILNAQDQHMLGHPVLFPAQVGGNTQGKALFTQQHVAAVAGVDGHNGVVLGELDNIAFLGVQIRLGMEALDKIAIGAQGFQHGVADTGHDVHGNDNIDRVGDLDAVLGKGRADDAHGIGDDVHGAALHRAVIELFELCVHLLGIHPVVGGACVFFFSRADKGTAFYPRHVVGIGAVEIAARELFLIEGDEFTGGNRLGRQPVQLFFLAGNQFDSVRLQQRDHLIQPGVHLDIVGKCHKLFLHIHCPSLVAEKHSKIYVLII